MSTEKQLTLALEPIVEEVLRLQKQLDGIELVPGPAGSAGADGADGKDGKDGADADVSLVAKTLATDYTDLLRGEKGNPGNDGKDGRDGTDGKDGLSVDAEAVAVVILKEPDFLLRVRGEKGDAGDRGADGGPGPAGPAGSAGADGVGIDRVDLDIERKHFELVLTDGTSVEVPLIEGAPGQDGPAGPAGPAGDAGQPGIGIKDIRATECDVAQTLVVIELEDGTEKEFTLALPAGPSGPAGERGVDGLGVETKGYEKGKVYREGSYVSANIGQFFKALTDTVDFPGVSDAWERVGSAGFRWLGLGKDLQADSLKQGDLYIDGGSLFCCMEDGQIGKMIVQRGQRGEKGDPGRDGKDANFALIDELRDSVELARAYAERSLADGDAVKAEVVEFKAMLSAFEQYIEPPDDLSVGVRSYRGDYDATKQYRVGDIVRIGKNFWLAIRPPVVGLISDNEWVKFGSSASGAKGAKGDTGPAGPIGAGITAAGSLGAGAAAPANPTVGDTYLVTGTLTGWVTAAAGDSVSWNGTAWVNNGPFVGPAGPVGATGPAGPAGAKGDKGDPGSVGPAGPAGPAGATGPAGPAGAKGDPGVAGPKGDPGAAGPAGPIGLGLSMAGSIPAGGSAPINPTPGALYMVTGDVTGWVTAFAGDSVVWDGAQWINVGPIKGAQGDPGADSTIPGPAGPKGDKGDPGPAGPTGSRGPQGDTGSRGPAGPAGPAGADSTVPGPAGPAGPKGDTGADSTVPGPAGPKGDQGDPGPVGPKGDKGDQGFGLPDWSAIPDGSIVVRRGGQLEWHRASSFAFVADDIIETPTPQPLHVANLESDGLVEAKAGGFKFPDGTVQTTANFFGIAQYQVYAAGSTPIASNGRAPWPATMELRGVVDPMGWFDQATRRIIPKRPGKYKVYTVATAGQAGVSFIEAIPFKNGGNMSGGLHNYPTDIGYLQAQNTILLDMNGTTDYLQCGVRVNNVAGSGSIDLQDGGGLIIVEFVSP